MSQNVVRLRLVGDSEAAVDEAVFALVSALAEGEQPATLDMRPIRRGRHGEWLAYGRLTLCLPNKPGDG